MGSSGADATIGVAGSLCEGDVIEVSRDRPFDSMQKAWCRIFPILCGPYLGIVSF